MKIINVKESSEYELYVKATQIAKTKEKDIISLVLEDETGSLKARTTSQYQDILYKDALYCVKGMLTNIDEFRQVFKIVEMRAVREEDNIDYSLFYKTAPVKREDLIKEITIFLNNIEDANVKLVVDDLYKQYFKEFFSYPAATTYHHSYVLGLAYHTLTMLKLAENLICIYPYLDKSLMYAGIILHDIAKIVEFSNSLAPEYTLKGKLLGHLVMGSEMIEESAKKLKVDHEENIILLKHIIVSHHGRLDFGACKKPQIAEAEAIYLIDTIDSKFEMIRELYNTYEDQEFTSKQSGLEGRQFYIHKKHLKE